MDTTCVDNEQIFANDTTVISQLDCLQLNSLVTQSKRTDYLQWREYSMSIAIVAAKRSKDPTTQVGCVITNSQNIIMGTGYNGFPYGCSDDILPWTKGSSNPLENKHMYVVHAEMNALINIIGGSFENCTMYTTRFPESLSAKVIIQARISRIIYLDEMCDNHETTAARRMFDLAKVKYNKFQSRKKLDDINNDSSSGSSTCDSDNSCSTGKREDYLEWNDYFMEVAMTASKRSKDPQTQVGCVIVNDQNIILGTGYNGLPIGCCDDNFDWKDIKNKPMYVIPSEVNAVLNKTGRSMKGAILYSTLHPCNECAKLIIQAGITRVIYLKDRPNESHFDAAKKLFKEAGVEAELYNGKLDVVVNRE